MAAADSIPTPVVGNNDPLGLGNNNPIGLSASLGLDAAAAAAEASFFPKPVEVAKIEDSSHVIITFKRLDFDSPPITEPLGVEDQEVKEERGDNDDSHVTGQEDCLLPLPPLQRMRSAAAAHKHAKCTRENEELPRSMRRKVHVTYHESDSSGNGEDYDDDTGLVHHLLPPATNASKPKLPIGVVRGCPSCHGCQKVVAAWRPDAGCKPYLDEAPVFYPKEEEFKDPLTYIASIRTRAEPFGICRVVPPRSWRPPCPLQQDSTKFDEMWFPTRVQQVHKLQVREPISKESSPAKQGRKRRRGRLSLGRMAGGASSITGGVTSETRSVSTKPLTPPDEQQEFFGFEPGIPFQLGSFERYAKDFKVQYFRNTDDGTSKEQHNASIGEEQRWEPSLDMIEGEYWRIVEQATDQIEVLYGADVETGQFGSGFPKAIPGTILDPTSYEKSGWNLNNIARQPGSLLSFEEGDISGVLVPWLYIGMCFSSFCWHVEDHHFYSLNYLHWGAPKIWYGVPSFAASQLEAAMKKHLPDLFDEQPDLLHKLVTQLSPSILKQEGIPVYRLVQQAGDYVITFPHAYHSGFNSGFNVAEAVNVAPVDWLLHGQAAVELYREQCRKTSVSHDKLLLRAVRLAVKMSWWSSQQSSQGSERWGGALWKSLPSQLSPGSVWETKELESEIVRSSQVLHGQGGVLARALEDRVKMECARLQCLKDIAGGLPSFLKKKKMDSNYDVTDERECELCKYDLHLSAVSCVCCPDKFSCLLHGHLLCSCPWNKKTLLYRYTLEELALLLAAVQGQPGAVSKWTNFELQLSTPDSPPSLHEEKKLQIHPSLRACVAPQQPEIQQVPSNGAASLQKSYVDIGSCIPNSSAAPAGTVGFPQQVKMEAVALRAGVKPHVREWVGRLLRTEAETEVQQPLSSLPLADIPGNIMGAFNHNMTESETGVRPSLGGSMLVANGANKGIAQFSEDVRCRLDAAVPPLLASSLPVAKNTAKRMAAINSSSVKTLRATGNGSSSSSSSFVVGSVKKEAQDQPGTESVLKFWSGARDDVKESASKPVETNASSPWVQHEHPSVEYLPPRVAPSPDVRFGVQYFGLTEQGRHHYHHPSFGNPKLQGSQKTQCVAEVIVLSDDEDDKREGQSPKAKDVTLGNSVQQPMICVTARMADCPFDEDTERTSAAARDKASEGSIQRDSAAKIVCYERDRIPPCSRELVAPFTDGSLLAGDRSNAGQQLDLAPPVTKSSQPLVAAAGSVKPTTQVLAVKYDGPTTPSSPPGRQLSVHNNNIGTTTSSIVHHVTETAKADTVVKVVDANGRQQNGGQQQPWVSSTITTGPRVARVVRSKRSSVELLDTGCLVLRSGWHNKHVIFPAGFKSQIRFYDLIDISHSCIYVSEILDQGAHTRPLFKVSQPSSSEVFLNESVDECWREIQTRVNNVITHRRSQHNKLQQQQHLPPLLPPLNGLEMFGLTSPSIVQAVEALDPQHQCIEYWTAKQELGRSLKSQDQVQKLRSVEVQKQGRKEGFYAVQAQEAHSRSLLHKQGSLASQQVGTRTPDVVIGSSPVTNSRNESTNQLPQELLGTAAAAAAEADTSLINRNLKLRRSDLYPVLRGFFRKADTEELQVLHRLFHGEMQGDEWCSGVHALTDELQTRIS